MVQQTEKSQALFERACKVLPGGVNSPVRAFNAVGGCPRFMARASGARLWDVDGNEYIDCIGSWGPMILGHGDPEVVEAVQKAVVDGMSFGAATGREAEMGELISQLVPQVEMIRMVNSGTEAVMSALRAARGFTRRHKIVKFAGCYHGHADSMLVKAGSGVLTGGDPDSAGVTPGAAQDTLLARYNDLASVETLFAENPGQIAAVIVEPVGANMGVVPPAAGFLQGLRKLCDQNGTLLIFDEVITGFRLALGGAQEYFGVSADLVTYGKIIGGGMPVGAYGGRREIMSCVSPLGKVYQAGTLSGNPVAMAAGLTTLRKLQRDPGIYDRLAQKGQKLAEGLRATGLGTVNQVGSLLCLFFQQGPVTDYESAKNSDTAAYARYFQHMLSRGIYLAPAQFEAMFLSDVHTQEDLETILAAAREFANQ